MYSWRLSVLGLLFIFFGFGFNQTKAQQSDTEKSIETEPTKPAQDKDLMLTEPQAKDNNNLVTQTEGKKRVTESTKALWKAHILRVKDTEKKINSLQLYKHKLPVYLLTGDSIRPLVKLNLNYKPEGQWTLFIDKLGEEEDPKKKNKKSEKNYEILPAQNSNGDRTIYAYLTSRLSTIRLVAQNADGNQEEAETIYLFAPEAREIKMVSLLDSLIFYAGHTYFVYRQTSFGTFVSQSLLLGAKYISPDKGKRFGYLGDAAITVYTYHSSPLDRSPNYFEARLAGTYSANVFKDPKYRSRFSLGVSTVNLFSYGSPFGFSGLYGPNFGFRTEYFQNVKNSYTGEIQFIPYESKDMLSERSIKLSVEWTRNIKNIRVSQLGLSYASHKFTDNFEEIDMDVLSIYFGLSF